MDAELKLLAKYGCARCSSRNITRTYETEIFEKLDPVFVAFVNDRNSSPKNEKFECLDCGYTWAPEFEILGKGLGVKILFERYATFADHLPLVLATVTFRTGDKLILTVCRHGKIQRELVDLSERGIIDDGSLELSDDEMKSVRELAEYILLNTNGLPQYDEAFDDCRCEA